MSERFTVGKPVDEVPAGRHVQGEIPALVERVGVLRNGQAIPLEFPNVKEARDWASARYTIFRGKGIRLQVRGAIIYLSKMDKQS